MRRGYNKIIKFNRRAGACSRRFLIFRITKKFGGSKPPPYNIFKFSANKLILRLNYLA